MHNYTICDSFVPRSRHIKKKKLEFARKSQTSWARTYRRCRDAKDSNPHRLTLRSTHSHTLSQSDAGRAGGGGYYTRLTRKNTRQPANVVGAHDVNN
jgi:hypothetical protein